MHKLLGLLLSLLLGLVSFAVTSFASGGHSHHHGHQNPQQAPKAEYLALAEVKAGVLTLTIQSGKGLITTQDLTLAHTQYAHLMILNSSMETYYHLHPKETASKGVFAVEWKEFEVNQGYIGWLDVVVKGQQQYIPVEFKGSKPVQLTPSLAPVHEVNLGGYNFTLQLTPKGLNFQVKQSGRWVELQPIMGEFAHVALFSQSGALQHTHPLNAKVESSQSVHESNLWFHTQHLTGVFKVFVQVTIQSKDYLIPFTLVVG